MLIDKWKYSVADGIGTYTSQVYFCGRFQYEKVPALQLLFSGTAIQRGAENFDARKSGQSLGNTSSSAASSVDLCGCSRQPPENEGLPINLR